MPSEFQQSRTVCQPQRQPGDSRMDENKNGTTWAISSHVRATISPDGAVLLDIEKGLCYSLNVVGAKIWQVIESGAGHATFKDLVNALASQFNVSQDELARDIEEYLQELEKKLLIKAC
jgi:Coenzyme PQQ synthesis protein D (PqqD)